MGVFKKIDSSSQSAVSTALNIFTTPATNVTVSSSNFKEILPLNSVDSFPLHFKVHAGQDYLDLSQAHLVTEMCIRYRNAEGDLVKPDAGAKVAPIQGIGSTFIRNLKILLNGREITNSNSLYSFKSYIDTELSYSREVKNSYLSASGWFEHDKSQTDATDASFAARQSLFAEGRTVQLVTDIHADLFQQERYLVNNCELQLEIQPQTGKFMTMCLDAGNTKDYQIVITACKLYVKSLNLVDGLALSVAQMLEEKPARYPLRKAELKSENISAGRLAFSTTLFTETVPRRIIVGLLPTENYEGSLGTSPFDFQNFNIRKISVSASGLVWPNVPYDLEWNDASMFTRPFHDMHTALGLSSTADSNGITMDRYKRGWTFFVFNTSTSQEANDQAFDLIKTGTVTINVKFRAPVPDNGIYMLIYGETDSLMLLDNTRVVTTDLSV